jgi:hypothetical protein
MTEQHRAAPEQWTTVERWTTAKYDDASCILELRDRIAALEAAQRPDQFRDATKMAPADSLVEKVADAIYRNGTGDGFRDEARAVIREVAVWLREGPDRNEFVASALDQEANR